MFHIKPKTQNGIALATLILGLVVIISAIIPLCQSNMNSGEELTHLRLVYVFLFFTMVYLLLAFMHYNGRYNYMNKECHKQVSTSYLLCASFFGVLFLLTYVVPRYNDLKLEVPNEFWYITIGYLLFEISYRLYVPTEDEKH